jgi:hypothetical protein
MMTTCETVEIAECIDVAGYLAIEGHTAKPSRATAFKGSRHI